MHITELNSQFWLVTAQAPESLSVFDQKENTSLKVINYGDKNDYPQELIRIVSESPIATACLDTRAKYMTGDGLIADKDTDFSKKILKNLNFDVWEQICYSWQWFEGVGLHLKFSLNSDITNIENQEFSTIRLGLPTKQNEKIRYAKLSESWEQEKKYSKFKAKEILLYNEAEISAFLKDFNQQFDEGKKTADDFREWNGALDIVRRRRPGQLYYPNPIYSSANGWIYVDGQIQKFHSKNIDNNFTPGFIVYVPFDLSGKDDKGRDKKDAFKEEIKKQWLGAENAGEPAVLYGKTPESAPQIIPFSSNGNDKLYLALQSLIVDNICTATKVPPALANIRVEGGINTNKDFIINEFDKFLNTEIKPDQNRVLERLNTLIQKVEGYDGTKLSVSNSRPLAYIPDAFKDDYSLGERRESNGYPKEKPVDNVSQQAQAQPAQAKNKGFLSLFD